MMASRWDLDCSHSQSSCIFCCSIVFECQRSTRKLWPDIQDFAAYMKGLHIEHCHQTTKCGCNQTGHCWHAAHQQTFVHTDPQIARYHHSLPHCMPICIFCIDTQIDFHHIVDEQLHHLLNLLLRFGHEHEIISNCQVIDQPFSQLHTILHFVEFFHCLTQILIHIGNLRTRWADGQ